MNWKPVLDYEGFYEISDEGICRRLPDGQLLKPHLARGYVTYYLDDGPRSAHSLVMEAFIGKRPAGREVNHRNGVKGDNRLTNLEYLTHRRNIRHALRILGVKFGPKGPHRKNVTML